MSAGMSPISSKNRVPPLACSKRPRRWALAPVNAPFSWPNSSDSIRSLGMAAMFKAIKGLVALGLWRWSACATSSLPVPDSPLINTVILDCAKRPMARNTSCIAGASPMISVVSSGACSGSRLRFLLACCSARWVVATASSTSKGLGKYSKAPPW